MSYTLEALRGVKGFVIAEENGEPLDGVQLRIKGRESREFNTTKHGEYWRILLDGNYTLLVNTVYTFTIIFLIYTSMWVIECVDIIMTQVSSDGFETQEVPFRVEGDEATVVNVTLWRQVARKAKFLNPADGNNNSSIQVPDSNSENASVTEETTTLTTSVTSNDDLPVQDQIATTTRSTVVNYVVSSASFTYFPSEITFFAFCIIFYLT